MTLVSLSSFTNPHGERVHQVFYGGMPITRELGFIQARDTARVEAKKAGQKTLGRWDADLNGGEEWVDPLACPECNGRGSVTA